RAATSACGPAARRGAMEHMPTRNVHLKRENENDRGEYKGENTMHNQKQVQVFFSKPSGGTPPPDNLFELTPVVRYAYKVTPARGALEALLGNVTPQEESHGFMRLDAA